MQTVYTPENHEIGKILQPREAYTQYQEGKPLEAAFKVGKIPLFTMELLRRLNYRISRGISYEQTVDCFLRSFSVNDSLRSLRAAEEMVILLNEEGALIRRDKQWSLIFAPEETEHKTLSPDADLYSVWETVLRKLSTGEYCQTPVPVRSLKSLVSDRFPFSILDTFCLHYPGGYRGAAARIVTEGPDFLYRQVPVCRYGDLATVDVSEIQNYHSVIRLMREYVHRYDLKETGCSFKPLSIAVFGAPGSGKSFGVKQIAKVLGRFDISTINLSQYHSVADFFHALRAAVTHDSESRNIPLIFFDEFDAELDGVARGWLKYFLAPMQDGEFSVDGKTYTIPGAVFVFAGAAAASFAGFLPHGAEEEEAFRRIKGPDFVSRLKGILNIMGPNPAYPSDRRHIIRRALLLRSMLIDQAPSLYDPESGRVEVSRGLLQALLNVSEYRHGSRSIEFILGMSRLSDAVCFNPSSLPMPEQLDIHLDVEDFTRKITFEQAMGRLEEEFSRRSHESYLTSRVLAVCGPQPEPEALARLMREPDMANWESLAEIYKQEHRNRFHYLGERLLSPDARIGLRPVLPGATDTLRELYGPALEELSEMEHERWLIDKTVNGWTYGEIRDHDLRTSPSMVPYAKLPEAKRDHVRIFLRSLPGVLADMGYELYRRSY